MTPSGAVDLFLYKTEINEKEGSSAKAQPKNKERRRTRMNDKREPAADRRITLCEKRDILNKNFCCRLIHLDASSPEEMVEFQWKCYKAGWSIADADDYAWLNTLFGYDIGMTCAAEISRAVYERAWSPMELGVKDRLILGDICGERKIAVSFDTWVHTEPECMAYYGK